ncbi:hypothetical protein SAMN03159304_01123 [Pseudomonas sp. NFACC24-1]|uniref:hypothetical protein n=1 Tax=Pseudomonas sp. NFACC24-1 TaxID=1566189 RepID=UPI0008E5E557|nr:hypothetical protein [Pseudomonas sp. NFACC24-1]SFN83365.1 hypothetical protein SAMN03159304_01123 [Pseudomonas sp. NFACC24-1]
MSAKKLFEVLIGALLYLLVSLLWFAYAVPGMLEHGTDAALITMGFGSLVWLAATGCIVIYIIQKARPA